MTGHGDDPHRGHPHWFEALAEHMGPAYLRYSFTKGTEQEVDALVAMLGLRPGERVLDVGCGPGRHAHALARRGMEVVGVDISQRFVELAAADAPPGATFDRMDARELPFEAGFDVVISLCQGAFGLAGQVGTAVPSLDPDGEILERMARALVPGGRLALSAFSAYFQVRHLESTDTFDADHGVNLERTEVWDPERRPLAARLWTSCFTPRELRLLAAHAGLVVDGLWSVTPGRYGTRRPSVDEPELLLIAHRPVGGPSAGGNPRW